MIWFNKFWFQIMRLWFNLIHDRCQYMCQVTHNVGRLYQGQSLLPCRRRSKGLSTRLHRVSRSHKLARPLPQVHPPSSHVAFLRRLVLNSDYISSFLCVCVYGTVVLADVSCRLIDVQAATYMYVWRISCSVYIRWVMTSVSMWWTKNSLLMSSECFIYFFLVALHY